MEKPKLVSCIVHKELSLFLSVDLLNSSLLLKGRRTISPRSSQISLRTNQNWILSLEFVIGKHIPLILVCIIKQDSCREIIIRLPPAEQDTS